MNILQAVKTVLTGKVAQVKLEPVVPVEAKDNTPVNRRLNRILRIKLALDSPTMPKGKRDQLQVELDKHMEEFKANSVALQFLQDVAEGK
jgi:hypothetical protein